MSADEFFYGKGKREFRVTGVITIGRVRGSPNKRKITPEKARELVETAYQARPWVDDEYPAPREYSITAKESDSWIEVEIVLHDFLRQAQLRPFAKFILNLGHSLCYGELEYLQMRYEVKTSQFLGFGIWG